MTYRMVSHRGSRRERTEAEQLAARLTELLAGDRLAIRVAVADRGRGAVEFDAIAHVDGGDMIAISVIFPESDIRAMLTAKPG